MKNLIFILIILASSCWCKGQNIPSKEEIISHYGFTQKTLEKNGEKIVYYLYQKEGTTPDNLIVYLQGSDPSPQFSYRIKNGKTQMLCWLNGEFKLIPERSLYVVIEKPGFEGVIDENNIPQPEIYQQKNSLDNRVFRANEVINHLADKIKAKKVIVYGHSEGAPVAAKLGTVNNRITHLGFWAGNALPDFYDFILENRVAYYKGEISDSVSQGRVDKTISNFTDRIARDTSNTTGKGYTNLRWWSYSEPPLNHLLKLEIPVFVQVATLDKSAPIESTYLIPLEFARMQKTNLSYNVCVGCDHGFNLTDPKGNTINKWHEIFKKFLEWSNQ